LIRASRTTPSRSRPRKPGQRALVEVKAGSGATAPGLLPVLATRGSGDFAAAVVGAAGGASLRAGRRGSGGAGLKGRDGSAVGSRASSRSSGVGVQRQWRFTKDAPLTPLVRTSVWAPHASRIAAAIERRRGPLPRPRLATAHTANARPRAGSS